MQPTTQDISLGYVTIPLHPLHPLLQDKKRTVITAENWRTVTLTPDLVEQSVLAWGPSILFVRDEFITYNLCRKAIESHVGAIYSIKRHLLSPEQYYDLCMMAVQKNGTYLHHLPQTQELADTAIANACWALLYCKDQFKTYANCMSAVSRNGKLLQYVPLHLIDTDMCAAAVTTKYTCLNHIPPKFLTQTFCEAAVQANGENIQHVPDVYMSSDLGMLAIKSPDTNMSGSNAQYIPAKYLTKEIIVEAVKRWSPVYNRIPPECITPEIQAAVAQNMTH
jgi:hypothetical protein